MSTEMRKSWLPPGMVPGATLSNGPPEASGFEASWERFRAEAAAVDAGAVKTFPYNAAVVLHNVRAGVAAVVAERPWFDAQADGPRVDYAALGDAELAAEALVFAADQAAALGRVPTTVTVKIARGPHPRALPRRRRDRPRRGGRAARRGDPPRPWGAAPSPPRAAASRSPPSSAGSTAHARRDGGDLRPGEGGVRARERAPCGR